MSSSPDNGSPLAAASQPCENDVSVPTASDQVAAPQLRHPPKALSRNPIVRSRHSRVNFAQNRQRHKQYDYPDALQLGSSTNSSSSKPVSQGQNRPNPGEASNDTVSKRKGGDAAHLEALPLHTRSPTCSVPSQPASRNQDKSATGATPDNVAKKDEEPVTQSDETPAPNTSSCCLCLSNGADQYAIVVDLTWPGQHVFKPYKRKSSTSEPLAKQRAPKPIPKKGGTETQAMRQIQDALYQQIGKWKKWLWCYEIRTVEEVNFHFDDIARCERAAVLITRLDAEEIRRKAQETMDNAPTPLDYEFDNVCASATEHTPACDLEQDQGLLCIRDRVIKASERLQGYRCRHWLKESLQKPKRSKARRFLGRGLLQESFVYPSKGDAPGPTVCLPKKAKDLANAGEMRGIYVTMGWNFKRMVLHTRIGCTYAAVGLAFIWLGSVLWAGHRGDWSTAFAFGQLLAASFALMLHHT